MTDIWSECHGPTAITPIADGLIRVVENQEQVATNALVDSLEEQALLEEMLEASKPAVPPAARGLHYLLATPFRYPPLRHGSRFGGRYEPGLFYGAKSMSAALAEAAYYRFVFWSGMTVPPPAGRLMSEHTVFGANYETGSGIRLQQAPFEHFAPALMHPSDYSNTQQLGMAMRDSGIEAFEYRSARDPERGLNVALFTPAAFASRGPEWQQAWICETRAGQVSFFNRQGGSTGYGLERFLVDGRLPVPAA